MKDEDRVVVVGSGPAGAAATAFLCRAGVPTLVLEAGEQRSAFGVTARLHGMTIMRFRRRLQLRPAVTMTGDANTELFEELAPGGLSNHWSCAVPRFAREDFEDAARAGEEYEWPIGYDDIAPWYDRVEPLLRIAGSREDLPQLPAGRAARIRELSPDWYQVAALARRFGRTVAPMPYAYGSRTTLTLSGNVFNAFVRLVEPLRRAGRVEVRYGARVSRLEWSPRTRRVEAVTYEDQATGSEVRVPCRAVVLGAGAVATAQILLQSTSADFPDGLGNTHGVLGRYLHDHPLGKLIIDLAERVSVHPPIYLTRPTLEHSKPLYAAACMQWSSTGMLVKNLLRGSSKGDWLGFSVFGTMAPSVKNGIKLDKQRSGSARQTPLEMHVELPPEARTALEDARDQIVALLGDAGWRPRVRIWKIEAAGDSNHYGGTCRMHAKPELGMLDAHGRLHAVPNVVVADSAAFTTGPEKNPVLTAMTLAARASDRLATELNSGSL